MHAILENAEGDEGLMIEAFKNGRRKGESKALVKTSFNISCWCAVNENLWWLERWPDCADWTSLYPGHFLAINPIQDQDGHGGIYICDYQFEDMSHRDYPLNVLERLKTTTQGLGGAWRLAPVAVASATVQFSGQMEVQSIDG